MVILILGRATDILILRSWVGPQQHIEKLRKEAYKHYYFCLNRSIILQKPSDYECWLFIPRIGVL